MLVRNLFLLEELGDEDPDDVDLVNERENFDGDHEEGDRRLVQDELPVLVFEHEGNFVHVEGVEFEVQKHDSEALWDLLQYLLLPLVQNLLYLEQRFLLELHHVGDVQQVSEVILQALVLLPFGFQQFERTLAVESELKLLLNPVFR